ncbi:MMPL family transporter [Nocardioides sp. zg-1228]|uniref:MMPL family transporter n=1 Tax=Nocardioides sp. zg-1228 TaxID=2763008 RepID=UPI0016430695|nr:MMPL family transporter [Nocardioides sp. zg-1228]MBC2932825.1 MMPL family transporter [Nocardioides sp. zg-1228]QSF56960.1 MMPL family transporter [Nocardioides sp. zg-1228]
MERLARACARRRFVVLAAWVVLVVAVSVLSGAVAGETSDDYALAGSESERAAQILQEAGFDVGAGTQAQLVFRVDQADDDGLRAEVDAVADRVRDEVPEARVVSPYEPEGARQLSPDRSIGYVAVDLPRMDAAELADVQETLSGIRETSPDLRLEVGGIAVEQEAEGGPPSELIGILAAVVILLFAFGSVIAMGLPILVGVIGAASGIAAVGIGARWVDMPSFAAPVSAMIAIGVGIDYALLVVTRYREALAGGEEPAEAVVSAQATAGRSVLFAGVTVVIASLGLVLMGLELITGVALGIAVSVLLTMLAAVTLLPAMLAVVGRRIDRYSIHLRRRGGAAADGAADGAIARRWSRRMQRHPLPWALASTAVLLVMSIPVLDMRLGFSDAGTKPPSDTARRAYDLMAEGFGAGSSGPLVVAVRTGEGSGPAVLDQLQEELAGTPGVAAVSPPAVGEGGDVAVLQVVPGTGPRDERTTDLVHRLREDVVPSIVAGEDVEVAIGGTTAAAVDFADYTAERLPVFLAVVLGLALLLLVAVFRGIAVAVKAVVVNLLSIGAAFGATVAVFQWGWGVELLDLGASAPVEAWAPMMLIAIVFGLSMDYEVFLLSRIKEERHRTGDSSAAVVEGLARTARVITAAAAIMICVFGSFVLGSSRELQLFGFGLAFAVLVDATLVRMVLVPSVMQLLGDRAWWLPRPLDRVLPTLDIEPPEPRQGEPA